MTSIQRWPCMMIGITQSRAHFAIYSYVGKFANRGEKDNRKNTYAGIDRYFNIFNVYMYIIFFTENNHTIFTIQCITVEIIYQFWRENIIMTHLMFH